jgi:hypothetical protein
VSHPSLGLPPPDETVGAPAAARLRAARTRLAARAVQVALERDPGIRDRRGEAGLRKYLHDAGVLLDRLALAVATADSTPVREFADHTSPVYRRNRVPLDDLIHLAEGLRSAAATVLTPDERPSADGALTAAIEAFRWHRRLAGDARKRNRLLAAIYKGA